MQELAGRPSPEQMVCGDCGCDLDPESGLEVRYADTVMKVCQACFAVREELDRLLD
jgi:hypothetical protein